MLNAGESIDVIVTAINGIAVNTSGSERAAVALIETDDANVDFDIVEEIMCEDTCDDALESAGGRVNQTTTSLKQSLENGSFVESLTSNAASASISSFENASVSAEDFSSDEPEIEVVTPASSSTEPSSSPSSDEICDNGRNVMQLIKRWLW